MVNPINITAAGGTGTHSVRKVIVNAQDDYIYFKNGQSTSNIPLSLTDGTGFIYSPGVGAISGLDDGDLVFTDIVSPSQVQLTSESNAGSVLDLTGSVAGSVSLNTPVVFDNRLNIDASTATNQAVKYYTDGEPLNGLVSGNTYFLKNVSVSDFAGEQSLYALADVPTVGQQQYVSPGTFSWVAPAGVTEVSVVCVGGGGGGSQGTSAGSGAGGGGLGWRNRIQVTPGTAYTVVVGAGGTRPTTTTTGSGGNGGQSYFITPQLVAGNGGTGSITNSSSTRAGGTFVGEGGGNGGAGGVRIDTGQSGGGGGAGGYTGAGGNGAGTAVGTAGAGGGGGGGGRATSSGTAGSGGGVGLLGAGANGVVGLNSTDGKGGGGGSGGTNGAFFGSGTASVYGSGTFNTPGAYGGGAGASDVAGNEISAGGGGAVRIIWGAGRAFPSTNTGNL